LGMVTYGLPVVYTLNIMFIIYLPIYISR
jgi:hypothetical protein